MLKREILEKSCGRTKCVTTMSTQLKYLCHTYHHVIQISIRMHLPKISCFLLIDLPGAEFHSAEYQMDDIYGIFLNRQCLLFLLYYKLVRLFEVEFSWETISSNVFVFSLSKNQSCKETYRVSFVNIKKRLYCLIDKYVNGTCMYFIYCSGMLPWRMYFRRFCLDF